jgi:hypothetical protein
MNRNPHALDVHSIARSESGQVLPLVDGLHAVMTTLPPSMYPQVSESPVLLVCDVTSAARLKPKVNRTIDFDMFRALISLE